MHLVDLISFNCFEFEVLVSELLTNLSAFLMVIEFLLALNLLVFIDLHLEQLRMMFELLFLLILDLSFSYIHLFLGIDNLQEFISFLFGLLSQVSLLNFELHLPGLVQVFQKALLFVNFQLVSHSGVSFTLFESSLCPFTLDISHLIGDLLLCLSEHGQMPFTILFQSDSLSLSLVILMSLFFVVLFNSLSIFDVLHHFLFLEQHRLLVGLFNFHKHDLGLSLFLFDLFFLISNLLLLSLLHKHQFPISQFGILLSLQEFFINLVDNHLSSFLAGLKFLLIPQFFLLSLFQSLNLHHEIEFLLLFQVILFQ